MDTIVCGVTTTTTARIVVHLEATLTRSSLHLTSSKRSISSLSLSRNPNFSTNRTSLPLSTPTPPQVNAFSTIGVPDEESEASTSNLVGANDLLIVGPGILGRVVAEKWREEHPGCQIIGQTVTTDHHDELIKLGINPSLKGMKVSHKFPYVIFCAPRSRTSDYPGDVSSRRKRILNLRYWSGV